MKMLPPAGMSLTLRNTLEFPSYQESPCIYDAKDALYREPKVGNADARNPFRSRSDSLGGCGGAHLHARLPKIHEYQIIF